MPRRRPRPAALPPLERTFEESRHSTTYLIMAFEQASPTLRRRIRASHEPAPDESKLQMSLRELLALAGG
jgi:hypothetical protein